MLSNQKASVDQNMVELTEALKLEVRVFLHYLETRDVISLEVRELIIRESSFSAQEVTSLLHILKETDSGWQNLLGYMRANSKSVLADKLQNEAEGICDVKSPKRSSLETFSLRLAQYYKLNYSDFPTMGESTKHVKDVWVPLQIDGRREAHLNADRIDHVELLTRLKFDERRNVALIKGDPGMGKTTLAKKIAYDWAVDYSSNGPPLFRLVLAVPLRSVGKSTLFDQLAIDYFCSIGGGQLIQHVDRNELREAINNLGEQLLVILDGLVEYDNYSESAFKVMFSGPFQHSSTYSNATPPMITFKLIITSRPYACERIQMDFPLLRYVILSLDADHLDNFVQFYCDTSHGAARVTEYLKTNAQLVINVPLILTFVCYLADSVEEIPTNMTSLYDSFIRQMLRRENRQEKLAESVDIQSWKDSNVVKATSELAYRSLTDGIRVKYEYSEADLNKCHVTNDSFICGFLLHKFNFTQESLKAQFPHRSIQEFFAALHCYQLMLSGCNDDFSEVKNVIILRKDRLVGRFFFGICSKEIRFDQMTEWLRPSLCEYKEFPLAAVINAFGSALADCSSEQNFTIGQKLFDSAGDLEDYLINFGFKYYIKVDYRIRYDQFSDDFKKGLHLSVLSGADEGLTNDWFLADSLTIARLVYVQQRIQRFLEEKLDQIDFLVLRYDEIDRSPSLRSAKLSITQPLSNSRRFCQTLVDQIQQLPSVKLLVVTPSIVRDDSITITVVTVRNSRELGWRLKMFKFYYSHAERNKLLGIVAKEKLADLTVDESDERLTYRKLKVTVNEDMSQATLILSLMQMSLLG